MLSVAACGGSSEKSEASKTPTTAATTKPAPERGMYTVKVPAGYERAKAFRWGANPSEKTLSTANEEYVPAESDVLTVVRISVQRVQGTETADAVAEAAGAAMLATLIDGVDDATKSVTAAERAERAYNGKGPDGRALYASLGVKKIGTSDGTPAGVTEFVIVRVFDPQKNVDPFSYIDLQCGRESECSTAAGQ